MFYVGATLITRALTPRPPPIEGPRLKDLSVSTSAYGQTVIHGYGTTRVGGNMIWALPIREQRTREKVGGKGGRSQKVITYTYYGTFAVAVGEGPIEAILRIWADSKLVYDRGGAPLDPEIVADRQDAAASDFTNEYIDSVLLAETPVTGTTKEGWRMRFYNGTEDQMPDPAIEADRGVGETVPHRGLAYVVFDDCLLTDFGNRIPLLSFEVAWKADPIQPIVMPTYLPDSRLMQSSPGPTDVNSSAVNFQAGLIGIEGQDVYDSSPTDDRIRFGLFDLYTNIQVSEFLLGDVLPLELGIEYDEPVFLKWCIGLDGYLFVHFIYGFGYQDFGLFCIDPLTQSTVWSDTQHFGVADYWPFHEQLLEIGTDPTPYTLPARYLIMAPLAAQGSFRIYESRTGTYLGGVPARYSGIVGARHRIARGYHDEDYCEAWLLDAPEATGIPTSPLLDYTGDPIIIHRVRLGLGQTSFLGGGSPDALLGSPSMLDPESEAYMAQLLTFSIAPADLAPYINDSPAWTPTSFLGSTPQIVFDSTRLWVGSPLERTTGEPMFFCKVCTDAGAVGPTESFLVKLNPDTGAIMWATPGVEIPSTDGTAGESRIESGVFAFTGGGYLVGVTRVNTYTGEIIGYEDWANASWDQGVTVWYNSATYDSRINAIVDHDPFVVGSEFLILLDRAGGNGVYLWEIVQAECLRAGYEAADLDVTQLTDLVLGYHIEQVMSARSAIEPLAIAYQFDGVESDWKLKFLKRGASSVATITQDDLAVVDEESGVVLIEQRTPDKELPQRVTIAYHDKDKDYQTGAQYAARPSAPVRAMESDRHVKHDVPVVFRAEEVKQRASWLLYEAWIGRTRLQAKLPWAFLRYDPLDVVTVTLNDGTTFEVRIVQFDLGADWSLEARFITEDAAVYVQTSVREAERGVGGGYDQTRFVGQTKPSRLLLIDSPLLLDSDDTGRLSSRVYVAASPGLNLGVWNGAVIYQSADGTNWADGATVLNAPVFGRAVSALAAPASPWLTDTDNELVVSLARGTEQLESITDLQLLNGGNPALLINSATGDVELIQYRDVEQLDVQRYRLSHLLRGRRGTDTMMSNHAAGDLFIVPDTDSLSTITLPLSALNSERYYRAVTVGGLTDSGQGEPLTMRARDLMPYAPCQQAVAVSGSDLVLSWVRRTRIGGEWLDGTESVPLAEDTEAYEVDIYDGAAVVRTLTASTPSVTYTAAQIAADFGSTPDTLKFCVYQLSAQVGRGFGEVVTVQVPGRA